jgi:ssDNA-binding Zn-finger/Zn-ribbon topoisomerase 1
MEMPAEVIRCPRCGGSNIVEYRGSYECMDCRYVFTSSEISKNLTIEEARAYIGRSNIQKVLHRIKDRDIDVVEPRFTYVKGVEYPLLQDTGLSLQAVESALEDLNKSEVLVREASINITLCPTCHSYKLSIQLVCPVCGSLNIEKGQVLEHLTCGYIGFETDFQRDGRLICPKCRKPLIALGVDYKRQKNVYKCLDCGSLLPLPDRRYVCENNHVFHEEELVLKKVYRYRVNPATKNIIEQLTLDLRPILVEAIKLGLYVRSPATVRGKSGVEHEFSIAFWRDVKCMSSPDAVIEIRLSDEVANEMMILALYAKMIDVGVRKVILAVLPELDEEARKLARIYGIKVIESRDLNKLIEDVKENLKDIAATLKATGKS